MSALPDGVIASAAIQAARLLIDALFKPRSPLDSMKNYYMEELKLLDELSERLGAVQPERRREQIRTTSPETAREQLAVGCLPCARAHLATIAGTLKEALRFAREDERGVLHPEVVSRLETAEEDITVIERHDWTPEKILNSPEREQRTIREFLPKLRELRQDIIDIDSVEDLEAAAAKAGELSVELRLAVLRLKSPELADRVVNLSQQVQDGKMTVEEARAKLAEPSCPICASLGGKQSADIGTAPDQS